MMDGKEKIYFLLDAIDDARTITPAGQPLIIDPTNDLNRNYRDIELAQLFIKLANDEKILKVLQVPSRTKEIDIIEDLDPYDHADDGCWRIELLPTFVKYFAKIRLEPEYQEFTGYKPASQTRPTSNDLMTYEEKLDLIVKAVVEAKKATRKDQSTTLYINATNGLDGLDREEIHNILLQLQDENALKVNPKTNRLLPLSQQPANPGYFFVDILEGFDDWLIRYRMKQKSKPENIDWLNLLKALDVCSDIDKQLQVARTNYVSIPSFPYPYIGRFLELFPYDTIGTRKTYQQYRWEGVQYLIKEKAVFEAKNDNDNTFGYGSIGIKVNLANFDDFYTKIKQEFEKRKQKADKIDKENVKDTPKQEATKKTDEKDEPMYQITYTKQRQVLMNNAQIGKPDFNSENDLVFSFLYEHPNKRITREELEKAVGGKLTKSLHKIVENLGFEGDTKEVFFSVSKNAIEFRNPITKKDLEEMKKPLIKLVKGGGKLVIPH